MMSKGGSVLCNAEEKIKEYSKEGNTPRVNGSEERGKKRKTHKESIPLFLFLFKPLLSTPL